VRGNEKVDCFPAGEAEQEQDNGDERSAREGDEGEQDSPAHGEEQAADDVPVCEFVH